MSAGVRVGITLPSFAADPEPIVECARRAERAGVDGIFVFDHLFRRGADGARRPSLDAVPTIGAITATTTRITVGTLVFRAWLRPAATLASIVETAARVAPGRFVAGVGAGDAQSQEEDESFGLGFGSVDDRLERLTSTVRSARDRGAPIWIGGNIGAVREIAATESDGWNSWGSDVEVFAAHTEQLRARAERPFTCSWAGLMVLGASDDQASEAANRLGAGSTTIVGGPEAVAAAIRSRALAGADWVILGPLSAREPLDVELLGERVVPLVH